MSGRPVPAPAALVVLCAGLAFAAPEPAAAQHSVERTAQLDQDGYFKIWNLSGTVRVTAWGRDSVRVEGTLDDRARSQFYFGAAGEAGKMGVGGSRGEPGSADLHVTVPRGATVWIKTATAPVEVTGVEGGVDVYSVTGDVSIEGSPRMLNAESMGGRIEVAGEPRRVRLKSGSGDAVFSGSAAEASFSTVRGRIDVRATTIRHATLETVGGAVGFEGAIAEGGSMDIRSHDGPIRIALSESAAADFWVQSITGRIDSRLGSGRDPATRGIHGRELRFTIGGGVLPTISIRTFSGGVTLVRRR